MRITKLLRHATACTLILGPAVLLHGQEVDVEEDEAIYLSPFEVRAEREGYVATNTISGTRTQEVIRNVPLNIQIITEDVLEDTLALEADDALDWVAVAHQKNPHQPKNASGGIFIRGFETAWNYRNGIRVWDQPTVATVDRVEVVKGPSAVLYGLVPPGGIYNVITKKPLYGRDFGLVTGTIGTDDYYRATFDGNLGTLADDTVAVRLNALWAEPGSPLWDPYYARDWAFAPAVGWRPFEKTEIRLEYVAMERETLQGASMRYETRDDTSENPSPGAAIPPQADFRDIPWNFTFGGTQNVQIIDSDLWFLTVNQEFTRTLSASLNLFYSDRSATARGFRPDNYRLDRGVRRRFQENTFANENEAAVLNVLWTPEIDIEVLGEQEHKFLVGGQNNNGDFSQVFYRQFDEDGRRVAYYLDPRDYPNIDLGWPEGFDPMDDAERVSGRDREEDGHNEQAWLSYTGKYWDERFIVNAGIFYTDIYDGGWEIVGGERVDYLIEGEDTKPMVGVLFKPIEPVSVFLLRAESYQQFTRFRDPFGNPFDPVGGESWEGGVKFEAWDGRFSGTVSVYEIKEVGKPVNTGDIPDPTLPPPEPGEEDTRPLVPNYQAVGESTSEGLDVDIVYSHNSAWQLLFSYGYNDAYVSADPNESLVGRRPDLHAYNRAALLGKYTFQEGPAEGLGIVLGLNWSDEAIRRFSAYIEDPATGELVGRTQDSMLEGQLSLIYTTVFGGLDTQFQLTVKNLLEEEIVATRTYRPEPNGALAREGYYREVDRQFLFTTRIEF